MNQTDINLIHKFIDDGLQELKDKGMMTTSQRIPIEMQDGSFNRREEYNNWKPIKSTVTEQEIKELENIVNCPFPKSFKAFLKYKHFYELFLPDAPEIQFYTHGIYNWQKQYREFYSYDWVVEDLISQKFIPFADYEDWGFLCFDARKSKENNEYPILMIDHELVGESKNYQAFNSNFMEMIRRRVD